MSYRWVSWYHDEKKMGAFELHFPWWTSGYVISDTEDNDIRTICAAFPAELTEHEVELFVRCAYDKKPSEIRWRFNNVKEGEPFNDRFPRADWMQWRGL